VMCTRSKQKGPHPMSTHIYRVFMRASRIAPPLVFVACSSGKGSSGERESSMGTRLAAPQLNTVSLSAPAATSAQVSLVTSPNADCSLHPEGVTDPAQKLIVYADDDGVVTFLAATGPAVTRRLSLDCQQTDGNTITYSIDLGLVSTFQPTNLPSPKNIRPALTGDPTSYAQGDLIRAGYGVRPDPVRAPSLYAAWLDSAAKPAKRLVERPRRYGPPNDIGNSIWGGPALTATTAPYVIVAANFSAPSAISFGNTQGSIWGGLGGAGNFLGNGDNTIIQCGIEFDSVQFAVTTYAWKEYFANNTVACQGGSSCLVPLRYQANDSIRSESWVCDNQGNATMSGQFGCFWLVNASSNPTQVLSCVLPNDPNCASIPQPAGTSYMGLTANYIIEKHPAALFSDYTSASMLVGAIDPNGGVRDFSTESSVTFDLTNLNGDLLETSNITGSESLQFNWKNVQ